MPVNWQEDKPILVLERKASEVIRIGDDVIVTVLGFSGRGKVRLGIEAPKEIKVHRQEVYDRIINEAKDTEDR